jgi:hypothetical protein
MACLIFAAVIAAILLHGRRMKRFKRNYPGFEEYPNG